MPATINSYNNGKGKSRSVDGVVTFQNPQTGGNWAGADKNACRPDKLGYMRDRSRTAEDLKEVEEKGFKHLMKDGVWLVPIAERPMNWNWMGGREKC